MPWSWAVGLPGRVRDTTSKAGPIGSVCGVVGWWGAAERELDLVDAPGWTDQPGSDGWVAGCVIVKAEATQGNRGVIHFGRDGAVERVGRLWMLYNTVITPYGAPVVTLSSSEASVWMEGNLITGDNAPSGPRRLIQVPPEPRGDAVAGRDNWVDTSYRAALPSALRNTRVGEPGVRLPWHDPARGDYRPVRPVPGITDAGTTCEDLRSRAGNLPLCEFVPPWGWRPRPCYGRLDLGALEWIEEP